jgi:hypothetical protein
MEKFIIEANIKHFEELLKAEADAKKREFITRMLAEQEAKLADLTTTDKKQA